MSDGPNWDVPNQEVVKYPIEVVDDGWDNDTNSKESWQMDEFGIHI